VAISPDGKHIYTASGSDNAVAIFGTEPVQYPIFLPLVQR